MTTPGTTLREQIEKLPSTERYDAFNNKFETLIRLDDVLHVLAERPQPIEQSPNNRLESMGLIPLNEAQQVRVKEWAADDRLWTTQETVEINLRTFARLILKEQFLAERPAETPCVNCGHAEAMHNARSRREYSMSMPAAPQPCGEWTAASAKETT